MKKSFAFIVHTDEGQQVLHPGFESPEMAITSARLAIKEFKEEHGFEFQINKNGSIRFETGSDVIIFTNPLRIIEVWEEEL